jgi:signal transduction histidine kinase
MTANTLPRAALPVVLSAIQWWRDLGRAHKRTSAVSLGIVLVAFAAAQLVGQHIQELLANRAAASTALYMDSVVVPLVQELASKPSLSEQNRSALEQLMSPASTGKPVVAFRIWLGDRIVFSTRGDLVGKQFPSTPARNRAFAGDVVASLGLEGDDEDDERALRVPILEIYAPVRQPGSNKIIALAETSELAVELMQEIGGAQYTSYAVLAAAAIGLILTLFGLTGGLQRQLGDLARQQVQDKLFHKQVCRANHRVLEINDRTLRRVEEELGAGPLQLIAFAQLRLDALRDAPDRAGEDVDAISAALSQCMAQIRGVSTGLTPAALHELPLTEVIGTAICLQEARTTRLISCEFHDLPPEAPYALKTCLYQFIELTLGTIFGHAPNATVHVCAKCEDDRLDLNLICRLEPATAHLADAIERGSESLRPRIEALGGVLALHSRSGEHLSVTANFWLGDGSEQA